MSWVRKRIVFFALPDCTRTSVMNVSYGTALGETAGAKDASGTPRRKHVVQRENDSIHPLLVRRAFLCGAREQGWARFSRRCFRGAFASGLWPHSSRSFSLHLRTRKPRV